MKLALTVVLCTVASVASSHQSNAAKVGASTPRANLSDPAALTRANLGQKLLLRLDAVAGVLNQPQMTALRLSVEKSAPADWTEAVAVQALANVMAAGANPRSKFGSTREFLTSASPTPSRDALVDALRSNGEKDAWRSFHPLLSSAKGMTGLRNNDLAAALDALFLGETGSKVEGGAEIVLPRPVVAAFFAHALTLPVSVRSAPSREHVKEWLDEVAPSNAEEREARRLLESLFHAPAEHLHLWGLLRDPRHVADVEEMLGRLQTLGQLKRLIFARYHPGLTRD